MSPFAYAVRTENRTYLLNSSGCCLRALNPKSGRPVIDRCVGAQFVACIHADIPGCLAEELTLGACALFVFQSPKTGRAAIYRTSPILQVHEEAGAETLCSGDLARAHRWKAARGSVTVAIPASRGGRPPKRLSALERDDAPLPAYALPDFK